ncbi:MAG: hypothetical protein OEZ40_08345, partial [Candidatus Bathyarchaeota archaeon]|nr:hypothetical protein [Candidatus Bathyarchaeota archaeon]
KSGPNQDQDGPDGIWDHPYVIDNDNVDRYPSMKVHGEILDETSPVTSHDYDGSWHTEDFTITLIATDEFSGVAETYYRINAGQTRVIKVDGQPLISTESRNNSLEYWSVDNFGNEESHQILTEIKLDKTAPDGSIIISNGDTYTSSVSVILTQTATDTTSGVARMRFSNDNVTWTSWETYNSSKNWALTTGDGTKTVYAQYIDNAGLISPIFYDTITLDTTDTQGLEPSPWTIAAAIMMGTLVISALLWIGIGKSKRRKKLRKTRSRGHL